MPIFQYSNNTTYELLCIFKYFQFYAIFSANKFLEMGMHILEDIHDLKASDRFPICSPENQRSSYTLYRNVRDCSIPMQTPCQH